jgi:holo-[acyl-carrier protein] synthase
MRQPQIGIDIIEIARIRQALSRWGERFLKRIYTESEIRLYQDKLESLAVRFAGKEAVIKALNPPKGDIIWREIEILTEPDGKPVVHLHGKALEIARASGISGLEISLSHSRENAVALVISVIEG